MNPPPKCATVSLTLAVPRGVPDTAPTRINPTSLGTLLRLNGMSLTGAEPGEYELVLRVRDEIGGGNLELREPFLMVGF
jgi:hypothetical protein